MKRRPLTPEERDFLRSRRRQQCRRKLMTVGYAFMAGWLSCQVIVLMILGII